MGSQWQASSLFPLITREILLPKVDSHWVPMSIEIFAEFSYCMLVREATPYTT